MQTEASSQKLDWYKIIDLFLKGIVVAAGVLAGIAFELPARIADRNDHSRDLATVEGQVLGSIFAYGDDDTFEIKPVFAEIWNDGQSDFDIEKVELRVFEASFSDISKKGGLKSVDPVTFQPKKTPSSDPERWVGVIDNSATFWREVKEARISRIPTRCTLHPGQSVQETFHVADSGANEMLKFEIQAYIKGGKSYRWVGLSNPAICRPGPSPVTTGIQDID